MGIYVLSGEEIEEDFKKFLEEQEGEVSAECIADAWNSIARIERWEDRLITCSKKEFKQKLKGGENGNRKNR